MAHVVCFSDTAALTTTVQRGLIHTDHKLYLLSASQLTTETRDRVCRVSPNVILLELTPALDNAHLYFFLRADHHTRNAPIILLSNGVRLEQQVAILQADGYLKRPFSDEQLQRLIAHYAPRPQLIEYAGRQQPLVAA